MIVIRHCDSNGAVRDHVAEAAGYLPARRLRDRSIKPARMRLRLASGAITFLDEVGAYTVANEHGGVVHYHIEADPKLPPVRRRLRR